MECVDDTRVVPEVKAEPEPDVIDVGRYEQG